MIQKSRKLNTDGTNASREVVLNVVVVDVMQWDWQRIWGFLKDEMVFLTIYVTSSCAVIRSDSCKALSPLSYYTYPLPLSLFRYSASSGDIGVYLMNAKPLIYLSRQLLCSCPPFPFCYYSVLKLILPFQDVFPPMYQLGQWAFTHRATHYHQWTTSS